MEENNQQSSIPAAIFEKWNKALLWLLVVEMSYLVLIIFMGIGFAIVSWVGSSLWTSRLSELAPLSFLPLALGFLLNFGGALGTLVLALFGEQRERSINDWIGHVLNWTYLVATGWLYIVLTLVAITSGGFID